MQDCFALIPSRVYLLSLSCCCCGLAITCIKAEIPGGIPEEAEGPQESTGWHLGAHFTTFGSHSNKHLQPLMADRQGVTGTSAVGPGSHSGTVDKRALNKSFQSVIFIQCCLKWFLPLICLLCDTYTTSP